MNGDQQPYKRFRTDLTAQVVDNRPFPPRQEIPPPNPAYDDYDEDILTSREKYKPPTLFGLPITNNDIAIKMYNKTVPPNQQYLKPERTKQDARVGPQQIMRKESQSFESLDGKDSPYGFAEGAFEGGKRRRTRRKRRTQRRMKRKTIRRRKIKKRGATPP